MKIKLLPIILFIIFSAIFFVLYKGLQNPNSYVPKVNLEKKIPYFNAKIFNTQTDINSEEIFKNEKFYLFNIWASWCLPCRDEHPLLIELSNQKNLEIIGLNYKDNDDKAKNFLKKFNSPYKIILSDKNGTIAIEWGAFGVPETFLIYNKKIIKKIIGPLDQKSLLELERLIK